MIGGRIEGITVAFISSLSFNFFHTRDVVHTDLVEALCASEVWFESAEAISAAGALPRVEAGGVVEAHVYRWVGTGFALPKQGVQLRVGRESAPYGRVVLRRDARHAVDLNDRLFALTLVELLALAISQNPGESLADLVPMPAPRAPQIGSGSKR